MANTAITNAESDDVTKRDTIEITKQQYIDLTYHLQVKVHALEAENTQLVDRVMTAEERFLPVIQESERTLTAQQQRIDDLEAQLKDKSADRFIYLLDCVKRVSGSSISGEPFNIVNQVKALRDFYDKHYDSN